MNFATHLTSAACTAGFGYFLTSCLHKKEGSESEILAARIAAVALLALNFYLAGSLVHWMIRSPLRLAACGRFIGHVTIGMLGTSAISFFYERMGYLEASTEAAENG